MLSEEAKVQKRSKQVRCLGWCCGITAAIILLLVIIIVILIFTVFKQKDPTLKVESLSLRNVSFNLSDLLDIRVDAVVDSTVTVHNPNVAAFKFGSTTAFVFYRGQQIAYSPVAAGKVGAKSSMTLEIPVDASLSGSLLNANLTNDVLVTGVIPLVTTVSVTGTAKIAFLKVKHVRVNTYCSVQYFLANSTETFDCDYKVKI